MNSQWRKPRSVPSNGARVRVVQFGDDYHRQGTVRASLHGILIIDFGGWEERYHTQDVEVWEAAS